MEVNIRAKIVANYFLWGIFREGIGQIMIVNLYYKLWEN